MGKQFFQKKFLPFALTAAMLLPAVPAMAATNDLQGHWAEPTITEWQKKGLIQGYEDGSFKPNSSITRAEFIVLTNNAKGFADEAKISFLDVKNGDWFYSAVAKAVAANYVKGYEDGTFHPNQTITRAEAAVILANITGLGANAAGAASFTDAAQIPAWAKGSIGAVAAAGYMSGYPGGSFGASAPITRAEAVSSLNRVLGAAENIKEDFIITEDGTVVKDKVITGDLMIGESVGDGDVYLENVTVEGDTFVKGGGSHSIHAKNSNFRGTVYTQKNNVHFNFSGNTKIKDMQMNQPSSITFDKDFSGSLKNLSIPEGALNGNYFIESKDKNFTPVENMNVDAKAKLTLDANISSMTVGEKAEDSSIIVEKDATVDDMKIKSKTEISGKGTIDNMDVGTSGVTTDKALNVKDITTSNGAEMPIEKPSTAIYGGGSSSSGGGSSRPSKPSVTIETHMHNYNTITDKFVSFTATGATITEEDIVITVKSEKDGTTTTLTEGTNYSVGILGNTITVTFLTFAGDTKYVVNINASSVGSSKYDIAPHTYRYDGLNKVTWQATTEGIEDIIPGTEITAGTAKAVFTVDGATTNNRSEEISATLQGATQSEAIPVPNSNISTVSGSKTVTVDLVGLSLSADTYTLTLTVHGYRLETEGNRYTPETNTVTTTFTVTEKTVTLGDLSYNGAIEFTSGASVSTEAASFKVSFPVTGIDSLHSDAAAVAITPEGSGIIATADLDEAKNNVVVTMTGTAPTVTEDTIYTATLTILKDNITPKTGYTAPTADLTNQFTFTVKAIPTTTAATVSVLTPEDYTVHVITGEDLDASPKTITFAIKGVSAMDTSKITVSTNYDTITSSATFTAPTSGADGTLTITLKGSVPADAAVSGGGLNVTIPKDAFTSYVDGYGAPGDEYWPEQNLKLDVQSAPSPEGSASVE